MDTETVSKMDKMGWKWMKWMGIRKTSLVFRKKKRIFASSSAEKCKKSHKSAVIYVIP